MERWPLPEGWEWRTLRDAVEPTEHRDPSIDPDQPFTYVDISSIDNREGTINEPKTLFGHEAPSRARKVIRRDDVILATTRPYLRNVALVPAEYDNQICSTGFCVLRSKAGVIEPRYLFHLCRSAVLLDQLTPKMRGASYPAVTDSDVLDCEIPLPPLETQRRIVARLDALLAEVAAARRLHAEIVADTARVMEAVLGEVFPDPFGELPPGWTIKTVGEISTPPQYGYTQSAKREPVGPKFLRITDIQNGQVDWNAVPHCEINEGELMKYKLRDGDIVFARSGATTGKTFLVRNPPEAVFASYLIRLEIIRDATPDFVYWFFQSSYYWSQIVLRGSAQPNMNAQILRQIAVPLPLDVSMQTQIVTYLNSVQREISELQDTHGREKDLLDQVEQAILAQAFRGEL